MNPAAVFIAAEVLKFALDVYRRHAGKPADWLPTHEDWAAIEQDVRIHTAEKFHADAAAEGHRGLADQIQRASEFNRRGNQPVNQLNP